MLTKRHSPYSCGNQRARQSGATLLVTLIVLVAMTLTAISLMRSMDTTNIIAGNLAFQQSATRSADTGVEAAIFWLEANSGGANLHSNQYANGYSATFCNPGDPLCTAATTWEAYFTILEDAPFYMNRQTYTVPTANPGNTDAVGNTVTYAIERLCKNLGPPTAVNAGCTVTPITTGSVGSSEDAGTVQLNASTQQYYRITSRTVGPHNAKSYVQAIIAL